MFKTTHKLMAITLLSSLTLTGCDTLSTPKSFEVSQTRLQKMVDKNWTTVAAKLNESHVQIASPTLRLILKRNASAQISMLLSTQVFWA